MKFTNTVGALALALSFGHGSVARADDGCCPGAAGASRAVGPGIEIQDGEGQDEAATIRELEARLNEVLVVEESGRVVLREEFKAGLPFPADRVQAMLGSFVELGPDGKIKIRDVEMVRPYLPMIQRFLSPESMERLRELQKLPPEERRDAMQRMFGRGGQPEPAPAPAPAPQPRPEPRPAPAPAPRTNPHHGEGEHSHARPGSDGHFHRDLRGDHQHGEQGHSHGDDSHSHGEQGRSHGGDGSLDERMARLEHRLDRMERALRDGMERQHGSDDRGEPRAERRRGGLLGELFGRGGDRGGRRDPFSDMGRRAGVWRDGLGKLSEILEPDDFQRISKTLERLRGQVDGGDLRDRGRMMEKLQDSVDPADIGRFMEIFSEFIATPEGREFAAELERIVERLEEVVNSDRGRRLGDTLDRMGQGDMRERMEGLMRGRDARPGQREEEARPSRRAEPAQPSRRQGQPRNVPEGAKLY
jgi:hypothetical protein